MKIVWEIVFNDYYIYCLKYKDEEYAGTFYEIFGKYAVQNERAFHHYDTKTAAAVLLVWSNQCFST